MPFIDIGNVFLQTYIFGRKIYFSLFYIFHGYYSQDCLQSSEIVLGYVTGQMTQMTILDNVFMSSVA